MFIKQVVAGVSFKVFNGIEPLFTGFFHGIKVKDSGVPDSIAFRLGEDDVWKVVQFLRCRRSK